MFGAAKGYSSAARGVVAQEKIGLLVLRNLLAAGTSEASHSWVSKISHRWCVYVFRCGRHVYVCTWKALVL